MIERLCFHNSFSLLLKIAEINEVSSIYFMIFPNLRLLNTNFILAAIFEYFLRKLFKKPIVS